MGLVREYTYVVHVATPFNQPSIRSNLDSAALPPFPMVKKSLGTDVNSHVGDLNRGPVRDSRSVRGLGVVDEFYHLCGATACHFTNFISGISENCGKWETGLQRVSF